MRPATTTFRRVRYPRNQRRAGFTLAELLVSVGILLVMLGLVGQVMSLTVSATGQATALTEVNRSLRILEQTLRDDFRGVYNGSGVLVIQGLPINAYWTQDGFDADDEPKNPLDGYPHDPDPERESNTIPDFVEPPRADLLMFFTQRQGLSYVTYPPKSATSTVPEAVRSNVQQVVYGHAYLGEYVLGPTGIYEFEPFPDAFPTYPLLSPVPAENWHLARRVIHLLPGTDGIPEWVPYDDSNTSNTANRLGSSVTEPLPLNPTTYRLLTGESDVVYNFDYEKLVLENSSGANFYMPEIFNGGTMPFSRSLLDESPPAVLAERLGHYFIPSCASFKVEWTFDPRAAFVGNLLARENQIFWIDLGDIGDDPSDPADDDPLASIARAQLEANDASDLNRAQDLDDLMGVALLGEDTIPYSLDERFGNENPDPQWRKHGYNNGPTANFAVFTANRGGPIDAPIADELFPTALRITVDVYDDGHRLARPIRHVMVIPIGS